MYLSPSSLNNNFLDLGEIFLKIFGVCVISEQNNSIDRIIYNTNLTHNEYLCHLTIND